MPYADRSQQLAYLRDWRSRNRSKTKSYAASSDRHRLTRNKALVQEAKDKPCLNCGRQKEPHKMHFHHRADEQKLFTVATGLMKTRTKLLAEIAKCDVLCDDCHRSEHRRTK